MKKIFFINLIIVLSLASNIYSETVSYSFTKDGVTKTGSQIITDIGDGKFRLEKTSLDVYDNSTCNINGETEEWSLINNSSTDVPLAWYVLSDTNSTNLVASRNANIISIKGIFNGAAVDTEYTVDDEPWIQAIDHSIPPDLLENNHYQEFWHIQINTLGIIKLAMENRGTENILLDGVSTLTDKVQIRTINDTWSATFWFGYSDKKIRKYIGNFGPGTVEMTYLITQ
jgi:hypothetical protein